MVISRSQRREGSSAGRIRSLVEYDLANVEIMGSSPILRSSYHSSEQCWQWYKSSIGRCHSGYRKTGATQG